MSVGYVSVDPNICAHSRNGKLGCTRCLDVCPTSSITPAGDHVEVDPHTCSGHGCCSAVCPTGAITYAMPAANTLFERLRVLLAGFRRAGGSLPQLLIHDGDGMLARLDLPAAVLPFAVEKVTSLGLDLLLTAFAYGATRLFVLCEGRQPEDGLAAIAALAENILQGLGDGDRRVLMVDDPAALGRLLQLPVREAAAARVALERMLNVV